MNYQSKTHLERKQIHHITTVADFIPDTEGYYPGAVTKQPAIKPKLHFTIVHE
ncbi:UNVERIFIED_CONTAM: hypothetical protein FKN15_011464 [Acipenser sinensis]